MRRQRFETLKVKKTSVRFVRPGFADHIDNSASGAAKFGSRSRCYNLKFLYRFQRDVDCRALATELLTAVSLIVVLDSVLIVSTVGVAVIVTVSCTEEIFIESGRFIAWPTVKSAFSTTRVANPCFVTVTVYLPGGNCNAAKRPSSSVVRLREKFVSVFLSSTSAAGTAAPFASKTVP